MIHSKITEIKYKYLTEHILMQTIPTLNLIKRKLNIPV